MSGGGNLRRLSISFGPMSSAGGVNADPSQGGLLSIKPRWFEMVADGGDYR